MDTLVALGIRYFVLFLHDYFGFAIIFPLSEILLTVVPGFFCLPVSVCFCLVGLNVARGDKYIASFLITGAESLRDS